MSDDDRCTWTTDDGRRCMREAGHKVTKPHHSVGVDGEVCSCMLRWYPNRCKAHPENNQ
jgi:hypothetical protein